MALYVNTKPFWISHHYFFLTMTVLIIALIIALLLSNYDCLDYCDDCLDYCDDLGAAKEEFHAEVDEPAEQAEHEHQLAFNDY